MNRTIALLLQFAPRAGATAMIALLAGCGAHDHAHDADGGHAHEPQTAQITVWGERHELFTEYGIPVAGRPVKFVTHVTDLQNARPRSAGIITYRLRQGDRPPIELVVPAPSRDGIYEPSVTFPNAGEWNVSVAIPVENGEEVISYPPVRVYGTQHDADHASVVAEPEGIRFLKEQQWKVGTRVDAARTRALVQRLPMLAQTRAAPGFSATLTAPLAGRLTRASGREFPSPGARVEAGEVLALLEPRFSDAAARFVEGEAEAIRAEALLKQAESAYERTKRLVVAEARSERELEEAELALITARARHTAAQALRSTYAPQSGTNSTSATVPALELRAPIAGIVTHVSAGIGEPVASDQTLFTLLNPEVLWIEARVPEAAIARLSDARDALGEVLDGTGRLFPIRAGGGRLVFSGMEVDSTTRTVPLIYELDNREPGLRVGQAVRLHVETANTSKAVAIPDAALVEEGGLFVAFVQVSGEIFQKRELRLGIRDGEWIQVLSGITEGERVVTRGAYAVRLASASAAIPAHGHTH